jgi:hypothetical protein
MASQESTSTINQIDLNKPITIDQIPALLKHPIEFIKSKNSNKSYRGVYYFKLNHKFIIRKADAIRFNFRTKYPIKSIYDPCLKFDHNEEFENVMNPLLVKIADKICDGSFSFVDIGKGTENQSLKQALTTDEQQYLIRAFDIIAKPVMAMGFNRREPTAKLIEDKKEKIYSASDLNKMIPAGSLISFIYGLSIKYNSNFNKIKIGGEVSHINIIEKGDGVSAALSQETIAELLE